MLEILPNILFDIVPVFLFILYIYIFYGKIKSTILLPIIFCLITPRILEAINFDLKLSAISLICCILVFALCFCICMLKGFRKNVFIIIAMSLGLLYEALLVVIFVINLLNETYINTYINSVYFFHSLFYIVGPSTFYMAILFFVSRNKFPSISLHYCRTETVSKMTDPETALKLLREKRERDMITEEEYQKQRAEIIRNI